MQISKVPLSKKVHQEPPRKKSAYELKRDANVARNEERLRTIGLSSFSTFHKTAQKQSQHAKKKKDSLRSETPSSPVSVSDSDDSGGNTCSDDDSDDEISDDEISDEIEKVLDYKCTSNGEKKLQIVWTNKEIEWATYEDVVKDFPELVAAFMKQYEEKRDERKVDAEDSKKYEKCIKCDHGNYQIGVTYMPEDQFSYFQPDNELHGVKCSLCRKTFVHYDPNPKTEIKASMKHPMFTCSNRATAMKCLHAVCGNCIKEQIVKQDSSTGKRQSRARRTIDSQY